MTSAHHSVKLYVTLQHWGVVAMLKGCVSKQQPVQIQKSEELNSCGSFIVPLHWSK